MREENRAQNQHRNTDPLNRFHPGDPISHLLEPILLLPRTPNFLFDRLRATFFELLCYVLIAHVERLSLLRFGLTGTRRGDSLETAAGPLPCFLSYLGILKSLKPTAISSEITSAGESRRLPVEGKNPDLRHLNLFSRVTSRPV